MPWKSLGWIRAAAAPTDLHLGIPTSLAARSPFLLTPQRLQPLTPRLASGQIEEIDGHTATAVHRFLARLLVSGQRSNP